MDAHRNLAYSLIATAPSPASSGTSLVVTGGQGTRFPAAPFNATVWAIGEVPTPSNAEIVRVTAVVGDTLTITRAQETTTARAIVIGDQIAATVTVKTFTDIETAFAGTASAITNGALTVNTSGISLNLSAHLTTAALSQDSSKYAGTAGAITGGSITVNTSGVSINLPAYLTTADLSQNSSKYAGTNGAITGGSITVNTSGVSVNLPAYLTTAALSNHSHGNPTLALTNLAGTTASNSAGLTLSLSATAQTTQTQNLHNVTISGNTSGALAAISSGTWTLAGGNNITLSQAGNAVTISGANVGGAQTGISGVVVSDTTYTSGTVSFSNAGNITISSSVNGATQFIRLSGNAAQTTQTQNLHNLTISGNTSGALAAVSSGTLTLAGGNNITLSQAGNAITISGANVGGAQTGISGIQVSDATFTSGTVSFRNANGISFGSSGANGVSASYTVPTVPAQFSGGFSTQGNTSGNTGLVTGRVNWVGGNNITLSGSTNAGSMTITISGAAAGGAQTAISGVVVSDTTYTSGTVSFSNQANITIGSSVNGATQYIRLSGNAAQTAQTQDRFNLTLSGNTAGAMAQVSSGTLTLAGGNNITLSQAGNAITISGAAAGGAQTAISGMVVSDTTYTSGTVSFSNVGGITISSSVNAGTQYIRLSVASQTVQTQNVQMVTLSGNTSGALAGLSSGTVTFAGGNGITLSQAGNAVTISASTYDTFGSATTVAAVGSANAVGTASRWALENHVHAGIGALGISTGNTSGTSGSVQGTYWIAGGNNITVSQITSNNGSHTLVLSGAAAGGAQTAISGVIVSDATYTSGTISFSNAGNITISSSVNGASQYVRLSVAAQTTQTQNVHNVTISGNTSGGLAAISSGTLTLAGGNNITLSQAGNAITISGPTFLTFDSATTVTPVGSANSVGTATRWVLEDHVHAGIGALGISTQGNTAGTTGSVQGSYWFRGTNNITVSQITSNNGSHTLVISGPSVAGAQTGISGIVASDTTYTSGTVSFSNQANITIGSSVNGATQYIRLSGNAAQTVQTQNLHNLTISGNTAGALAAISSGTLTLAGGNNITLSQAGNAITISGAAAGGAQTGISGVVVSDATYTSGTVSFSNAGNITISSSVNGATQFIRLSGNAAQTNQSAIEGLGVSNTGNTAGNTGLSTGVDWVLAGSGSITLSQSTAAGTNTIWVQHPAWISSQSTQFLALTLGGNSAGTSTFHATNNASLFLNGGNNITLSGNGSTVTISAAAQTVQTQNLHNLTISGNTAGALAAISSGTLTLAGGNNITLSQAGNAITISGAAAGGVQTGISGIVVSDATYTSGTVSFSNAGNITISSSVNGATQYIRLSGHAAQTTQSAIEGFGVSNTGNTAGNTGISSGVDWVLAGSGSITLSQSTAAGVNTIYIQHPAWLTSQSTQFLALTLGGNTAGTTTFHATNNASLFLHGGNNITLSGNGSTVTIVGGAGGGGLTNIRVSAGTTSNLLSDVTFADSNGVSFGINASTVTASVNTVGTATTVYPVATANSVGTVTRWAAEDHRHAGASPDLMFYDNGGVAATTLSNPGNATLYVFPFTPNNEVFPGNMSASSIFMNVTHSLSTAATFTNQISLAFYTSVNSTQLTRVFSASTSFGTNAGNMNINDSYGGTRWLSYHSSQFDVAPNFSQGVRYWCALWNRTSANAGSLSLSFYGNQTLGNSAVRSGVMGVVSVNNTSRGWIRFNGIYSVTFSSAMPAALAGSDINKGVVQVGFLPQVILNNVGTDIV